MRKKKSYLRSFVCFANSQSQLLGKLLPQLRDAFILGTKPLAGHFQFCLCGTHNEINRNPVMHTGLHQEASLAGRSRWTTARAALGELNAELKSSCHPVPLSFWGCTKSSPQHSFNAAENQNQVSASKKAPTLHKQGSWVLLARQMEGLPWLAAGGWYNFHKVPMSGKKPACLLSLPARVNNQFWYEDSIH